VTVTDMETATNGQIVVATWGRGAFRLHSGLLLPLPPRQCPTGRKYCEPAPDVGCDLCVPNVVVTR
jgi:hypothetical protein